MRTMTWLSALGVVILMAAFDLSGCSRTGLKVPDLQEGAMGGAGGAASSSSSSSSSSGTGVICEHQTVSIYSQKARIMLLEDISSSMAGVKWQGAKESISNVLTEFGASGLEFGLDTFPDAYIGNCSFASPVLIDSGPDTETAIIDELLAIDTLPTTPLYCAMRNFLDLSYAPIFSSPDVPHYLIVVADGEDTCDKLCTDGLPATLDDFTQLADDLVALGIKVIVIGFGDNVNEQQLNALASHGGTTFTEFIQAGDKNSLTSAFSSIGWSISSCVFPIAPPEGFDPALTTFYFDDVALAHDQECSSGEGWRWASLDYKQVEFCADSCALLLTGSVKQVPVTFGCVKP